MTIARLMQMARAGVPAGGGPAPSGWTDPDLSNASYDSVSFSVAGQETSPQGLFFRPDGTKMYVTGASSDNVNEYDLSTAWDITTASYLQNFSVAAQESAPQGLHFSDDGTKMYVLGFGADNVNEYNLSAAWDVSSASYLQNFSVAAQDGLPVELRFKPDGTKMYVLGFGSNVYEYSLSIAWDVSTASYVAAFAVSSQDGNSRGLFFSPNGDKFFMCGTSSDRVFQYSLTNPWDISTSSYDNVSFALATTFPVSLFFKVDGSKMYVSDQTGRAIYQYSTAAAAPAEWTDPDLANASYDSVSFSVAGQETIPLGINFNNDGTKAYIVGNATDSVYEYSLSTAWDLSTVAYNGVSFSAAPQDTAPTSVAFNLDGTKMYVTGIVSSSIYQYSLSTGFDISTASYDSISFDVSSQISSLVDLSFNSDGTKLHILGFNSDTVYQYSLSTGFDISTASYDSVSFSVTSQETNPTALRFNPDGTKMYVFGFSNKRVYQYSLSSAFDVSTSSYAGVSFSVAAQLSNPRGFAFKSDGSKMYAVGATTDTIYQYSTA